MATTLSLLAFWKFLKRVGWPSLVLLLASPSFGDVVYTGSSVIFDGSLTGPSGLLSSRATFTTAGSGTSTTLRLLLENTSPSASQVPSDLLTSFYFNVLSGTTTGTSAPLGYQSASGQVYRVNTATDSDDVPGIWTPPIPPSTTGTFTSAVVGDSNLKGVNKGDRTWEFKSGLSLVASSPPLAFGVGTVGNSSLTPNNFNGDIVDGVDFGIYVGDVKTQQQGLDGKLFVRNQVEFVFSGFGGYSLSQITPHAVFGFGSAPDLIVSVPEPTTLALAAAGLVAGLGWCARRRRPRPAAALQAALVLATLVCLHGSASAEITSTFNFKLGSGGFTASPQGIYSLPPINQRWTYRVAGPNPGNPAYLTGTSTSPSWNVASSPVSGTAVATGNYLTSPLIQLGATVDQFTLRVAHRYDLPANGSVVNGATLPVDAAQIEYSIDGRAFLPLAPSDWKQSGAVDVSLQPYVTPSNWGSVAVPTFVPGVGSTPPVYLLTNGGASFTGVSSGFAAGNFVGSETLAVKFPQATQTVEFRFTNVNLGNNCGSGGWDIAFVEATFLELPEPGGFALAAAGGVLASLGWIGRGLRRKSRRSITSGTPDRA